MAIPAEAIARAVAYAIEQPDDVDVGDIGIILTLAIITPPMGSKGFCDTIAKELASLNIGVTIVEPGAHQTSFGAGMMTAPVMETYENTPAGDLRRAIAAGILPIKRDVDKSVQAMMTASKYVPHHCV